MKMKNVLDFSGKMRKQKQSVRSAMPPALDDDDLFTLR